MIFIVNTENTHNIKIMSNSAERPQISYSGIRFIVLLYSGTILIVLFYLGIILVVAIQPGYKADREALNKETGGPTMVITSDKILDLVR